MLRRLGQRGSTTNSFGRLMLDPRSRQVFVEGVAIELTRRELALLEELCVRQEGSSSRTPSKIACIRWTRR